MTLRYEGVRFRDGSCALRRIADDPCDRATLTFESMRELEEDVGAADVEWIADHLPPVMVRTEVPGLFLSELGLGEKPVPPPDKLCGTCSNPITDMSAALGLGDARRFCGRYCAQSAWAAQGWKPLGVSHRVATIVGDPPRPAYVGDGHPEVRRARYERTEEVDEP